MHPTPHPHPGSVSTHDLFRAHDRKYDPYPAVLAAGFHERVTARTVVVRSVFAARLGLRFTFSSLVVDQRLFPPAVRSPRSFKLARSTWRQPWAEAEPLV